jgi:pyrimidine deaminase RibD-like protein
MEQSDLERMALAFRKAKTDNNWHEGNVTVFEYTDNAGRICHLVQETNAAITKKHAERLALEKLQREGIPPGNIHRIYSELEPCETPDGGKRADGCKAMLREEVPKAKITYSYEYRGSGADTRASRVASIAQRDADFNKYRKQ